MALEYRAYGAARIVPIDFLRLPLIIGAFDFSRKRSYEGKKNLPAFIMTMHLGAHDGVTLSLTLMNCRTAE